MNQSGHAAASYKHQRPMLPIGRAHCLLMILSLLPSTALAATKPHDARSEILEELLRKQLIRCLSTPTTAHPIHTISRSNKIQFHCTYDSFGGDMQTSPERDAEPCALVKTQFLHLPQQIDTTLELVAITCDDDSALVFTSAWSATAQP